MAAEYVVVIAMLCLQQVVCADDIVNKPGLVDASDDVEQMSMDDIVSNFQNSPKWAEKQLQSGVDSGARGHEMYSKVNKILKSILENCDNATFAETFVQEKGLERIILKHLFTPSVKMRTDLLLILKKLFKNHKELVEANIPQQVVDRVLWVFQNDKVQNKALVIEILGFWLPGNPKIQARIMRNKGLDPFYEHMSKFDVDETYTLLNLFNTILEEHLNVVNDMDVKTQGDVNRDVIYRQMGFLKKISSPESCGAILNIFELVWSFTPHEDVAVEHIHKLLKNIKPLCINHFEYNPQVNILLTDILSYVSEMRNASGTIANIDDIKETLEIILNDLKLPKDEL